MLSTEVLVVSSVCLTLALANYLCLSNLENSSNEELSLDGELVIV